MFTFDASKCHGFINGGESRCGKDVAYEAQHPVYTPDFVIRLCEACYHEMKGDIDSSIHQSDKAWIFTPVGPAKASGGQHPCKCDMRALMLNGCKCGGY